MESWARDKGAAEDDALRQKLIDEGMQFNKADHAAFVEASKPIYDAFADEVDGGKAMIDKAIDLSGQGS